MFEDAWKSIQLYVYERTTSPFIGSIAVTWSLFNFRFYVIVLGKGTVYEKIALLDMYVFSNEYALRLYLWPVVATAIFLGPYPYFAREIYKWWHKQENLMKAERQKLDDASPMTREEAAKLRIAARDKVREVNESYQSVVQENNDLRAQLDVQKGQKNSVSSDATPKEGGVAKQNKSRKSTLAYGSLDTSREGLSGEEIAMLKQFVTHANGINQQAINKDVYERAVVDSLISRGLVAQNFMEENYEMTAKGRQKALMLNLIKPPARKV